MFKIVADQHADLYFVRVYSGVLKSGSRALNPRTDKKELISQLWRIQADSREKIETDAVEAGDIVGVVGPKDSVTGDTFCDAHHPILLERIAFPETVISMAIEPDTNAERKKLADVLLRLGRQDPTFTAKISEETGQTIISGMGELHLEIIRERIQRDFGLKVRVHKPRVSYRESVKSPVEADGVFHRQTAGETHYAKVRVRLEPFAGAEAVTVVNALKPDRLPSRLGAGDGTNASRRGACGRPVGPSADESAAHDRRRRLPPDRDQRGSHSRRIRGGRTRGAQGQRRGPARADHEARGVDPRSIPGQHPGRSQRPPGDDRELEPRGHLSVLEANVPLSQMFGYSTQVRSLSQGRASYSMEPLNYAEAPAEVLREMMG